MAHAELRGNPKAMHKGLVFGHILGGLEMQEDGLLHVVSYKIYKDDLGPDACGYE